MSFVMHFESPFIHTWWNVNMPLQFSHAFAIFICICNFHISPYGSYVDVCNSHMHLQFSCVFDIFIIGSPNNTDGYRQQREWKQSNCYFDDNFSALCGFQCTTHEILYFLYTHHFATSLFVTPEVWDEYYYTHLGSGEL